MTGRCHYCGRQMHAPGTAEALNDPSTLRTRDHTVPKSTGGEVMVYACQGCNKVKGDAPYEVYEFFARKCDGRPHLCGPQFRQFKHDLARAGLIAAKQLIAYQRKQAIAKVRAQSEAAERKAPRASNGRFTKRDLLRAAE